MPTQQLPSRRRTGKRDLQITVMNPGKGLNNFVSENFINEKEASAELNVEMTEAGAIKKRYGYAAVGTGLVNAPRGLGNYVTTSVRQLLTIDGTSLKYLNGSNVWAAYAGGLAFTANRNPVFTTCRGYMFVHNGLEACAKLDGTTATRPGTTVTSAFGIYYKSRHFAAGTPTNPSRIYISNVSDPADFTVTGGTAPQPNDSIEAPGATIFTGTPGYSEANLIDVAKDDGDKITGFAKFQDTLIVFKERSIWSLALDSSGAPTVTLVQNGLGSVNHRGIENVDNDIFFPTRRGYSVLGNEPDFFNAIRTNEISQRVTPVWERISAGNFGEIAACYSDYTFYSSIPTGGTTTNNVTLTYDKRYSGWSYWESVNANAWTEFIDSSNVKHLYYADSVAAQVYEMSKTSFSDAGSPIEAYWQSKAHDEGDPARYKRYKDITLLFRQLTGTATVQIYTDGDVLAASSVITPEDLQGGLGGGTMGQAWLGNGGMDGDPPLGGAAASDSGTTATSTLNVPYRLKINKSARNIKVRIGNANNNESFVFLGYVITGYWYSHNKWPSALKISVS